MTAKPPAEKITEKPPSKAELNKKALRELEEQSHKPPASPKKSTKPDRGAKTPKTPKSERADESLKEGSMANDDGDHEETRGGVKDEEDKDPFGISRTPAPGPDNEDTQGAE